MYTDRNFRRKKDLLAALKAGQKVGVHQPGGMFPSQRDGDCTLEGPHFPKAHDWYARVRIKDGLIVKVLS